MDARQAQDSLDEVRAREQQVADVVARDGAPWWYVGGIAAAFLVVAASSDLDDLWGTGWAGPILDYGVPVAGVAVIAVLAMLLHRSIGVRPRRNSGPLHRGMVWLAVAFVAVYIGLGTVLRLAGVSWDSTISGAVAAVVFVGGCLALRRVPAQD
ncbi:hypothetical protein [Pseudonocardia sp. DLS-67]